MSDPANRVHGSPAPRRIDDEEITLSELLLVLWRYRLVLAACIVVAASLALFIGWKRTPIYEATSRILVSAARIAEGAPPVSLATYQAVISNQVVILEVMKSIGLTEPPYGLTPQEALQRHILVEPVRDTNILLITARLENPTLAAEFANRLAERSVRLAQEVAQDDVAAARDTIKAQLDESRARLEDAEQKLVDYRKQARLEALTKEVDVLLRERAKTLPLLVAIEAERARIRQTTEELGAQQPVRQTQRAVAPLSAPRVRTDSQSVVPTESPTRARTESQASARTELQARAESPTRVPVEPAVSSNAAREFADDLPDNAAGRPNDSRLRIRDDMLDPYVNPVYELLSEQLAASRTRLSELETQRAEILRATDLSKAAGKKLNDLYASEAKLERLEQEADIARRTYLDVSALYGQARLQVAGRAPQLQIIDIAVPPKRPVAPRIVRDTALAVLAAFVLASAGLLVYGAVAGRPAVSPAR